MGELACAECGLTIQPGLSEGLCADCLLKAGLGPSESDVNAPTYGYENAAQVPRVMAIEELNLMLPNLEVLDLLGQGGMGAVYRARQKSLDRIVALKVINPEVLSNEVLVDRFSREAKALAKLNHPRIVSVYDFGNLDGMCYLVMEYVDGTDLRSLIGNKEISPQHALEIVPQICEALQFAHDQGIVHRDIKPENILIDKRGEIKVADFGLAKLLAESDTQDNLTTTRQVMGTIKYMAPEQMEGSAQIDHRADIYSLGVVFYELLTGEVPLGRFAAPSERTPLDSRLDGVVMRALERHLPDRYQQASDIQIDVESISSNEHAPQIEPIQSDYGDSDRTYRAFEGEASSNDARLATGAMEVSAEARTAKLQSLKTHVRIVAGINIVFGALFILLGLLVFGFMLVIGSGSAQSIAVLSSVGGIAAIVMLFLGAPSLISGMYLWRFAPWSRIATLILAALSLFNFPIGTAIAAYTGWVLLQDDCAKLFDSEASDSPL